MLNLRFAVVAVPTVLATLSGPALADAAMLSRSSAVHDGPGSEFAILGYIEAGRVELSRCGQNANQETWCHVDRAAKPGWIHVVLQGSSRGGAGLMIGDPQKGAKPTVVTANGDEGSASGNTTGTGRGRSAAGGSSDGGSADSGSLTGTSRGRAEAAGGGGSSSSEPQNIVSQSARRD
jgi:hypothetical protein